MMMQLTNIQREKDYLCAMILLILLVEGAIEAKSKEQVHVSSFIGKILDHEVYKIESLATRDDVPIRIEGNLTLLAFIKLSLLTLRINKLFE